MKALLHLAVLLGLSCGSRVGLRAEVVYVEPPTVEDAVMIDGVRIDGSLNLNYNLGAWALGGREEIPLAIVHRLKTDPSGHSRSEMVVTGLTCFAVPADRSLTRCAFLGGAEVTFYSEGLGAALTKVGAGMLARRSAAGRLEVKSANGWIWVYENGNLVAVSGTSLLKFAVESQGGKVTRLLASRLGGSVGELTAHYDSRGNLQELKYGTRVHRFWYSGPRQQMTEWAVSVDGKNTRTRFEYENDLLVSVTQDEVVQRKLAWEAVPGGLSPDTEWPDPVRVGTVGKLRFSYDIDYKGYAMIAENPDTHQVIKHTLNPRRGLIEISENGKITRRIRFGVIRSQPGLGQVIRIEDGQQGLIAKYGYDEYGRVASFWAGGETDAQRIEFTYDQSGRHQKP